MSEELEKLLAPISEEDPCGPDLSYDLARMELEKYFHTDVSIDTSGRGGETGSIDWPAVIEEITRQFARSKDIFLAAYLCRAGAHAKRLALVELGAEALAELFARYWDGVHPRLGEVGLTGRRSPCDPLARKGAFLDPLVRIPLLVHPRLGEFSAEDICKFKKNREAAANFGLFRQVLQELGDEQLRVSHESFGRIAGALRRAETLFREKGGGEVQLDFNPTYDAIADAQQSLAEFCVVAVPEGEPKDAGDGKMQTAAPPARAAGINNRDDVLRALDELADYYRRMEPSSPVVLLLARAKSWVSMPFLDVLDDIVPESLKEARRLLLAKGQNPDQGGK